MKSFIIATRKSPLALWQAEHTQHFLEFAIPGSIVSLLPLSTRGDENLGSLNKIGGKGLFTQELEACMQTHRADIAVHSMKDMPTPLPVEFAMGAILPREIVQDAFVSQRYSSLVDLPRGAVVGTSSLRRQAQLLAMRSDLQILPLRGNVGTRLSKLDAGEYDAIVLAAAGLHRLGLASRITKLFTVDEMLPAAGQGAIGIEYLSERKDLLPDLQLLNHEDSWDAVMAERCVTEKLQGNCQVPIAAIAVIQGNIMRLRALVASPDGCTILRAERSGAREDYLLIGEAVAEDLCQQGALDLIKGIL